MQPSASWGLQSTLVIIDWRELCPLTRLSASGRRATFATHEFFHFFFSSSLTSKRNKQTKNKKFESVDREEQHSISLGLIAEFGEERKHLLQCLLHEETRRASSWTT